MLSRKKRIKQMNFQIQERRVAELAPLSDDDKYVIQIAKGHGKDIRNTYENILRTTGRAQRSQHI